MSITEIFQVLGIEETKDEGAIKAAYRAKLAVTNPEDNPEGFKRLRTAYEEACAYARNDEPAQEEEVDDTPSGQWVQKAAQIYSRIHTRKQVALWEELFEEDIFLSLEEEENCRMKLLYFLMDHFKLPTDVWKLLNEKLYITENATSLRENLPGEFVSYIVARCNQGEEVDFDKFEGPEDADYDLFMQYSNNCWDAINEKQLEQAEEYLKNADDLEIYHPIMELNRAWLWEKQGKKEEAIAWLEKLLERYENELMFLYHLAEMLWTNDYKERAAEKYEAILQINKKHYMANMRLTEWYYEQERYQEAKDCAEELLGIGVDDEFRELLTKINQELEKDMEKKYHESPDIELGLELGWCYLQDGKYSQGVSHVLELSEKVTDEKKSEYRGLLAKLYAESADYENAIKMAEIWEEALLEKMSQPQEEEEQTKDEDRVRQSYAIRSFCYRRMGYKDKEQFKKAIECMEAYEQREKKDKAPDLNMLMEKAFVYMEMDELDKCLELTRMLTEDYQIYAAYATAQEAYRKMWDAEGVLQNGYNCIHYFPDYLRPYERIAKVYSDLKYHEDLEKLLEDAKAQNFESDFLEACRYRMTHEIPDNDVLDKKLEEFRKEYVNRVENGRFEYYEKGLPILTEYLYWCPGSYMFVERGLFHKAAGQYDKAIADFQRALEDEPGNPYALNGLAYCYKMKGDYEQALICTRKAIFYFDDEYARSYSDLGDLYSLLGNHKMALKAYMDVLRVGGENIKESEYYMRKYAIVMSRNGRMAEAEKAINGAYGNHFERYAELVEMYHACGEEEKAEKALQLWKKELDNNAKVVKKEDWAKFYDCLAWHELVFGEAEKAVKYFELEIKNRTNKHDIYGVCDLLFACMLCGDDIKGRGFSKKLRMWLQEKGSEIDKLYFDMDKIRLERVYWSRYYTDTQEELEALLEKEKTCGICYFCTYHMCKELEAARVLHLFRIGKAEEAWKRIEAWQEKQPTDEYLRAIKRHCKDGVKVVPYSVNGGVDREEAAGEEAASKAAKASVKVTKPQAGTTYNELQKTQEKNTIETKTVEKKPAEKKEEQGLLAKLKNIFNSLFKS